MVHVILRTQGMAGFSDGSVEMDLPPGSTVAKAVDLALAAAGGPVKASDPAAFRNLIVVRNGRYVSVSEIPRQILAEGDHVSVMPLVVGG